MNFSWKAQSLTKLFVQIAIFSLFVAVSISAGQSSDEDTYYYYFFDQKQPLSLDITRVSTFEMTTTVQTISKDRFAKFGILDVNIESWPINGWSLAKVPASERSQQGIKKIISRMAADKCADFISPIFYGADGGVVIIKPEIRLRFKDGIDVTTALSILAQSNAGVVVDEKWGGRSGAYRLICKKQNGFDVLAVANTLAERPEIKFAVPNVIFTGQTSLVPNDTGFNNCWGIHNTGQDGGTVDVDLDGPEAWNTTTGNSSIVVVIIDNGIQQNHPDINQQTGTDTTSDGPGDGGPVNQFDNHGTSVAGCVSATINNSLGTVGIAPSCRCASARTFITINSEGNWTSDAAWTVASLQWAESIGARVTNNSNHYGFTDPDIADEYQHTRDNGMVHFAAAGNGSSSTISYPANLPTINAIAAIDHNGDLASFSNWGVGLAFSAPGVSIYTTDRTGSAGYNTNEDYAWCSGTSYASPYAAGVAALILSQNSSLTPDDVEQIMRNSSVDLGDAGYDTTFGWGLVNAVNVVEENHNPVLSNPRLDPLSGRISNIFEFLIDYYDPDGDPPSYKKLFIGSDIERTLSLYSGSAANGTYRYAGTLPAGSYMHFFSFMDSRGAPASTNIYSGPTVYPTGNCVIDLWIDGISYYDNVYLEYSLSGLGGPWTSVPLTGHHPDPLVIPVGTQVWFDAGSNSESFEYEGWDIWDNGTHYGGTNSTWSLIAPDNDEFEMVVTYSYNPQYYTISGTVLKNDGVPVPGGVTLTLTSIYQTLTQTTSNGNFSFTGVMGGIPVTITPSASGGYEFNPPKLVYNDLSQNKTGQTIVAYASDYYVPTTTFLSQPSSISDNSLVAFSWSGSDNVTSPANLQYQYKLDGIDVDWSAWTSNTSISYDVSNGSYIFWVRAMDEAGNINQVPIKSTFVVNAAPRVIATEKIPNSVWASRITLQMPASASHPTDTFILLPEHSEVSDTELVPVAIHYVDDENACGANSIIADQAGITSRISQVEKGWMVTLPQSVPAEQTVQYDIVWGKIKYFGWQEAVSIPKGFPNLSVQTGYTSRVECAFLDDSLQMWRMASKTLNRVNNVFGSEKIWVFTDIADHSGTIMDERLEEYLPGLPDDGSYGCLYDFRGGAAFKLVNNICMVSKEEKYEKIGSGSSAVYNRYHRYIVQIFDVIGQPVNFYNSDWQLDTFIDLPSEVLPGGVFVTGKTYNGSASTSELWFTIHNSQGAITKARTVFESVPRTNSGDLNCQYVKKVGNNNVFLFEKYHYTTLNQDRKEICYQIRNSSGNLVKASTTINPSLLPDTVDDDDEYSFEDHPVTDNSGRVWVPFTHSRSGQPDECYYIIIGSDGNIWRGITPLSDYPTFRFCDRDGYVWASDSGGNLLIYDNNADQVFPLRSVTYVPNHEIGIYTGIKDYQGNSYRLYDRWSPQLFQVNLEGGILVHSMEIYDLDKWGNNLHPANMNLKKDENVIWSQAGPFTGHATINISGIMNQGPNVFTITQDDFIGGQILLTFPYSIPGSECDLNNDQKVNLHDYAILARNWNSSCGEPDWCEGADIDHSGSVSLLDLAKMAEFWLLDNRLTVLIANISLDDNPGWTVEGEWAFGQPTGNGGINGNSDPGSGYTGSYVYGVNLNGDYSISVGGPYYLTAGPFNCNGHSNVKLEFARWLNSDCPPYACCKIEASNNGIDWQVIWIQSDNQVISDSEWRIVEYDISELADNYTTVYIRWSYEISNEAYPFSGWNIDDIKLKGLH